VVFFATTANLTCNLMNELKVCQADVTCGGWTMMKITEKLKISSFSVVTCDVS